MTSCVGVCGSLCAVNSDDTRTYSEACYVAETAWSGSNNGVGNSNDTTWSELNEYPANNLPATDWTPLNYFLVIFGSVIGMLLILGFIVAIIRERRYSTADCHSRTPQVRISTPAFHGVARAMAGNTGYLSYMDDLMTSKMRVWAAFVSTSNRPKKIIVIFLMVVAVCAASLYNIDVETDPIKLWVSTSSTSYQQRQHYGEIFNHFYRSEQVILVPKDGGDIYRSSILKEAIRVQNVAVNVTYKLDDGSKVITLDDICWKATGTGCTVNSYHAVLQEQHGTLRVLRKVWTGARTLQQLRVLSIDIRCSAVHRVEERPEGWRLASVEYERLPVLVRFRVAYELVNTYLGGFPDGTESNYTLYLESKAFVASYLNYNYPNDADNKMAVKWVREYIKRMKKEAETSEVFDVLFQAETSVQDEVDAESSNGMGPVALSYCLMIIYISLGTNRIKFSREFFISSKILAGFCGMMSIVCGVASTIGIYMWFGVKLELFIMEVVPFLSLAIGVDNISLTIHAMTEKEDQMRRDQPNLFVGLEHNSNAIEEITTTIVSESLAYIGPSIFMAPLLNRWHLHLVPFERCLWCYDDIFPICSNTGQTSRTERKHDIIFKRSSVPPVGPETQRTSQPLMAQDPKTPAPDGVLSSMTTEKRTLTEILDYCVDVYVWILTIKIVKLIVLLVFLALTLLSIYSMETLDQGLPQKEAMPSDSYMIKYFNALDVYLATGVPIYFVVETGYGRNPDTWSLNDESVERIFCKSKDFCGTYSVPNIMNALANHGDKTVTHISPGVTYSWMDDFCGFVNPDSECCRVNSEGLYVPIETGNDTYTTLRSQDDTCLASSVSIPPVPQEQYMLLFGMFATASAGTSCSYGGGSIYRGQFSIDTKPIPIVTSSSPTVKLNGSGYGDEITAWSYMATGTSNPTQQHFIDSYKQNLAAAKWIDQKTGVDIWVYSLTSSVLAAIFVVTTLYIGNFFYLLVITLTATNIVVLVLGLMQPLDVMLNGLSIVNLIIAGGISVEFCGHYVRFFAKAHGTGDERARDGLRQVLALVLFGMTITKIIGLSVLTLADSRVFKKYYFRMYMVVVMCGVLNGILLLPVLLLSTIMDVKKFFVRRGLRESELPSALRTQVE